MSECSDLLLFVELWKEQSLKSPEATSVYLEHLDKSTISWPASHPGVIIFHDTFCALILAQWDH